MDAKHNQKSAPEDQAQAEVLLKIALNEAQQSIRSYDTKAQICAIGYLFSLNLVIGINQVVFPDSGSELWAVLFGWCVFILPMFFFGFVLYPTRKSIKPSERQDQSSVYKVLYIRHERHRSVEEIKRDALKASPLDEVAFELYQSSHLRDRKRVRFVLALFMAGAALLIMFAVHLVTVIERLVA